ncbi:Hypothetical protein LUCI_4632 [Lucifera butyrica]|uniref:Uncharacterized protein n=1 Tax=Lucifera butyrica TaxID=1351585 RepID=A0A498RGY4_9FIRM|nr:Hypothetical protein LUCI_4632 [Lucifera butyrica]
MNTLDYLSYCGGAGLIMVFLYIFLEILFESIIPAMKRKYFNKKDK